MRKRVKATDHAKHCANNGECSKLPAASRDDSLDLDPYRPYRSSDNRHACVGGAFYYYCHSCYSLLNLSLSNLMGPSTTNPVEPPPPTFNFEKLSFITSLNNDSRAYRNLAMELIFLCRFFVQAHEQSLNSSIRLRKWRPFALPVLYPIPLTYK